MVKGVVTVRIMGWDHGSKAAGWGLIDGDSTEYGHFSYDGWPQDMIRAYEDAFRLFHEKRPDVLVFEKQASMRNAKTARVLLQVQSMAMLAATELGIPWVEIPAVTVKRIVARHGQATKAEVKAAVRRIRGIKGKLTDDEGDALGLALAYETWRSEQEARV